MAVIAIAGSAGGFGVVCPQDARVQGGRETLSL